MTMNLLTLPRWSLDTGRLVILTDDQPALTEWRRDSPDDLFVELTPGPEHGRRAGIQPPIRDAACHDDPRPVRDSVRIQLHRLLRAIALNTTLSRLPDNAC